jgi:nitroreductase
MFNDLSSPAALIATRRSGKPRDMIMPGPSADQMAAILGAASRVPDHGKLAPWRFVIVGTDQRADLAALLTAAYLEDRPDAGRLELESVSQFAHQAPSLIVVVSTPVAGSKIPVWEQQLSAGAACMQLLNGVHAQGLVGGWLTGWPAHHDRVKAAFGAGAADQIAGFIFIGSPARDLDERPRPERADIVSNWVSPPQN